MKTVPLLAAVVLIGAICPVQSKGSETWTVKVQSGQWHERSVEGIPSAAESFAVEALMDPVQLKAGDAQVVCGFVAGAPDGIPASEGDVPLRLHLREAGKQAAYDLWNRGTLLSKQFPHPRPAGWTNPSDEYQNPTALPRHHGKPFRVRLVVWPDGDGSRVRLFVDFDDRPLQEHLISERIRAETIRMFVTRGGQDVNTVRESRLQLLKAEAVTPEEAISLPPVVESVLAAVDGSHPAMAPVVEAYQAGRVDDAKALLLQHMKNRQQPLGPTLKEAEATAYHPDWQTVADEVLQGRYGTVGYFSQFASEWTDTTGATHRWVQNEDPLRINWPRCNGHLNRHFHWVSLARAYTKEPKPEYARRFSQEVQDWVTREPFFWERCPTVGGVNLMDGTVFRWGFMNTSNIGRRLELTWWPAYEVFRKSPHFNDDAHMAMLLGMLRQARLIMNPSSFAAHDDGGAHTTMALLQTALLLPEFKESQQWKQTALDRWDIMLNAQFHPDGSHVSLSTGYCWASIASLENYLRLMQRFGSEPPKRYLQILEKAYEHQVMLTTPSQTVIDLNDGGFSYVDDKFQNGTAWFPDRDDFRWMASRGLEGRPPEKLSTYFPNAGQYFMRTGWGADQKYLFFGAGPWGASHGKFDALNIYAQYGSHLLIRNAGRGSYSGVGNTVHAGRSLSFNTLSPDWAQENSIPEWKQDMHRGFAPPKRRFVSNSQFDYGEGCFEYGWHKPGEHIRGKWIRQVLFVKGDDVAASGYFVVIDTVEPADEQSRTWRHPWQLGLNAPHIAINKTNQTASAIADGVALQIIPVAPKGNLSLETVSGQTEPELLGWRVYDKTATPWPVPTYSWKADSTFCRAWVIQMQRSPDDWPIEGITLQPVTGNGELRFTVQHRSGRRDEFHRTFPDGSGEDVVAQLRAADGEMIGEFLLGEGADSVARSAKRP